MDPFLVTSGLVGAAATAMVSHRLHLLTAQGAIAQFILGWALFGLGGLQWAVPVLLFFSTSAALSAWSVGRRPGLHTEFAKGATRDAAQVLANGGVAGACVVVWFLLKDGLWYVAGVASIAAAAADTWGTELGIHSTVQPRLVTTWRRITRGASGGVTLLGTAAGTAGALLVAAGAIPWLVSPGHVAAIGLGGVSGSLVDSFLGATLQGIRRCVRCGKMTERRQHCGVPATLARGFWWMSNDAVNLLCAAAGAFAGILLQRLL